MKHNRDNLEQQIDRDVKHDYASVVSNGLNLLAASLEAQDPDFFQPPAPIVEAAPVTPENPPANVVKIPTSAIQAQLSDIDQIRQNIDNHFQAA